MIFYVGLHQPCDAKHFAHCCISINRLVTRKSKFPVGRWLMDSGAFTEISRFGKYRRSVGAYYAEALRWFENGGLDAIVAQDYMCEPFILKKTGLRVADHQALTIARYDALIGLVRGAAYVLPVLQGFSPESYVAHLMQYGGRLAAGAWVGVGSICKRNGSPIDIVNVLSAIKDCRPDLRLHGFGLKKTALMHPAVRAALHSADSMAWSFSARRQGRNANDWREAERFAGEVSQATARSNDGWQPGFLFEGQNG